MNKYPPSSPLRINNESLPVSSSQFLKQKMFHRERPKSMDITKYFQVIIIYIYKYYFLKF